ncbi:hypothetical protein V5799_016241 [Amblyomma americanum]|uniref:Lipocalin-5 1 n=1 Tax=Amblyomma americanum TaxID=6943 RepID=A0AAQ4F6S5_AMBAM
MSTSSALVLAILATLLLAATTEAARGPNVLQRSVPDAFQIFANFPYGVAIMDIDNDTILDCLTAKRKDYDPEAKTVTYIWSLNSGEGNNRFHTAFHHTAGATPDATNFTVGKECVLFVSRERENDVPLSCLEQFSDICGEAISLRDKHICVDDDTEDEGY